ncbi:DNA-3-methyladenine glycosylase I [Duncaniella freteri]|uniref:DNA-3-methyladenine glycosylase I n=1 Tax=Duncaniella freteri TaxID=2530391 RepID=UPI003F67595C
MLFSPTVSYAISWDMNRRSFKFFGTTICYVFLQSIGFIDDHLYTCHYKSRLV